ncbi:MAG: diguanylate cyclase [Oscillospiraceae bacterium]|nr:diguanylate cyclase [Oscillospiraceae bacterium]
MKKQKKHTILIIDDSDVNIAALMRILSPDYKILVAMSGNEGIELAKSTTPDLIILDIIMPDMDGFDTIVALKKAISTRYIPVIFVTALSRPEDETKGLLLGGSDYITKPFSPEVVKQRVKNQIRILEYIKKIEQLSRIDQLTGLPNRRSFHERLLSEWKLAIREKTVISLLVMDLDHFKKCNDEFGHLMGDTVLQKVAKIIDSITKRPTDFSARWGGEEFIVLLPKTDSDNAITIAELIRSNVENKLITFNDGKSTNITISIGVNTHMPTKNCSLNDYLHYADDALYLAKRNGRNNVTVHVPG